MCIILTLKKNQMPLRSQIENAVYNNWHGFGLIVRIDGTQLEVIKECPEKDGEITPDRVWELLEKYQEYERYLHVRHNTAGATSMDNTHPFLIYKSGDHEVYWMHNGTLYPYVSKKPSMVQTNYGSTSMVDDPDGKSDSVNFAEKVLTPLLEQLDGPNGKGDLKNPFLRQIITSFWTGSNRGLLVSSHFGVLYIDSWKQIEAGAENKFMASNDDYFTEVKRGPEFKRREESRKIFEEARKEAQRAQGTSNALTVVPLSSFDLGQKHGFFKLSESLCKIVNDWDVYDREGATALGFATKEEIKELYDDPQACLYIMDWIFTDYALMYEEMGESEDKHHRATKMIADLRSEVNDMQREATEYQRRIEELEAQVAVGSKKAA